MWRSHNDHWVVTLPDREPPPRQTKSQGCEERTPLSYFLIYLKKKSDKPFPCSGRKLARHTKSWYLDLLIRIGIHA